MPKSLGFPPWEQTWIITHFNGGAATLRCAKVLQIIPEGEWPLFSPVTPEGTAAHTLQYYSALTRNTTKHQA